MSTALDCIDLSVTRGQKQVLSHAKLQVELGEIVSIIGPTGSGKTTFMEICQNSLKPDSGRVKLFGLDAGSKEIASTVSFISSRMKFQRWATVNKTLQTAIHKVRNLGTPNDYFDHIVDILGMRDRLNDRVSNLSEGEVCRLSLASALVTGSKLIMIDEPSALLAYPDKANLIALLNETAAENRTVILLTAHPHLLHGLDTKVIFLRNGEMNIYQQSASTNETLSTVQIKTEKMTDEALRELRKIALKIRMQGTSFNQFSVILSSENQIPDLLNALVMHGAKVKSVYQSSTTLEEIYQGTFLD